MAVDWDRWYTEQSYLLLPSGPISLNFIALWLVSIILFPTHILYYGHELDVLISNIIATFICILAIYVCMTLYF